MKLIKIFLSEGRKEDLKKKYSNKFNEEVLDFILNISDLVDFNHKYTDFVLREIDPNTDVDWWAEKIIEDIKIFDKYQSQLQKKDINQYSDYYELQDAIYPFQLKEKEKELESQVNKIYEDDTFLVVKPKTEEASCKYGANTKWCVTSKGSGHFGRYTSGNQGLYFIIHKKNSSDKDYSKIAIHFNREGNTTYWDTQDTNMSQREIKVLNYAFPEMIKSIKDDYQSNTKDDTEEILSKIFSYHSVVPYTIQNTDLISGSIRVVVSGFQQFEDEGFGHAGGFLDVYFNGKKVDGYDIFVRYNSSPNKTFTSVFEFQGHDLEDDPNYFDCELERDNVVMRSQINENYKIVSDHLKHKLSADIINILQNNPKIQSFFEKLSSRSWYPRRINYGYTFEKNVGLIKKLVDWLDSSKIGTKLDFLVDIGKLDGKTLNGKKMYSQKGSDDFKPSVDWRGHFASFFASAKHAGILGYRKVGKDYFLTKGPNFEVFKSGELKAL